MWLAEIFVEDLYQIEEVSSIASLLNYFFLNFIFEIIVCRFNNGAFSQFHPLIKYCIIIAQFHNQKMTRMEPSTISDFTSFVILLICVCVLVYNFSTCVAL